MTTELEYTDRYGGNWPDPATVCEGDCEGMGVYPSSDPEEWPPDAEPDELGYVFVECPECNGTGKRSSHTSTPNPEESK